MTIAEIISGLEKEQRAYNQGYIPTSVDLTNICRLSMELARHVSKLEQEVFKL